MDGEGLLRKLQVKPGARMLLIGAPAEIEAALRQVAMLVGLDQPRDAALAFCDGPNDVARFAPLALRGLAEDGPLWLAYRKGAAAKQTGLSRDAGWDPLSDLGYRPARDRLRRGLERPQVPRGAAGEGSGVSAAQ